MAKRALLVGINDYPGEENDLRGCVNDTTNVHDVLVKYFGYQTNEVRLLVDQRATTDAILTTLRKLVAGSAAGDKLVFVYSGHGSQVRDTDGDEPSDKLDEVLCPHDFDWDRHLVKDDDLDGILSGLDPGVSAEIILDSCHSGTGTRELVLDRTAMAAAFPAGMDARSLRASRYCIRPRYLAPPPDIALRADAVYGPDLQVRRIGKRASARHVLWAACRSDQYSSDADLGGKPAGAFTYYFSRHIRDTGGAINRDELLRRVRASLRHEGFSQVPQLECPQERKTQPVFG